MITLWPDIIRQEIAAFMGFGMLAKGIFILLNLPLIYAVPPMSSLPMTHVGEKYFLQQIGS
jgi:hypothetical protein